MSARVEAMVTMAPLAARRACDRQCGDVRSEASRREVGARGTPSDATGRASARRNGFQRPAAGDRQRSRSGWAMPADKLAPINATLYKKLTYEPVNDFVPVALVASIPLVLVVNPSLPVRSAGDLVALVKGKRSRLSYASGGSGSAPHLAGELFKSMAAIDMNSRPLSGRAAGADRCGRRACRRDVCRSRHGTASDARRKGASARRHVADERARHSRCRADRADRRSKLRRGIVAVAFGTRKDTARHRRFLVDHVRNRPIATRAGAIAATFGPVAAGRSLRDPHSDHEPS